MKLGFCADVHLGNHRRFGGDVVASLNHRCRLGLQVLRAALQLATDEGCDHFVVCGDLLDYCQVGRYPEPQLLAEVRQMFEEAKPEVTVLMGNHEQVSTQAGDHALGPLRGACEVDEKPTLWTLDDGRKRVQLVTVPHVPGVTADTWLEEMVLEVLGDADAEHRLLAVHMGIKDDRTAPWLADSPGAIHIDHLFDIMESTGTEVCFAGDWHDHRTWSDGDLKVVQLGALVPTGWDNPGLEGYGTVGIYDTDTMAVTLHHLPGPRFVKLHLDEELLGADAYEVFVQVVAPPDRVQDALSRHADRYAATEVIVDAEACATMAREAADAARDAGTLDEALGEFVTHMPLEEGVDRARVLERCRGYLK